MIEENRDNAPEDAGVDLPATKDKRRKAFRQVKRELSNEDLENPAVQRMLLDEIERLESENEELNSYRNRFHEADKKSAIFEEKNKTVIARDILFGICLTIGAAIIGFAPSLSEIKYAVTIAIGTGALLILAGVIGRVVKK